MAYYRPPKPHYGGQLGVIGLLVMIGVTGWVAFNEDMLNTPNWMPSWAKPAETAMPASGSANVPNNVQLQITARTR
ncbi:MAG: hypothetical protein AAF296_11105 [Pseudomonadota bacterium]